ncbi:unnamed protein product [Protopolystoma xenopodis]|uniref:Uncharacterized protein n=1 Tax=Protopolystoma xenopodis TaxID=117903 RepID=A0A3S5A5N7_9PLAT|nr:unnamed protein product [Protopolystoma xenopodis]
MRTSTLAFLASNQTPFVCNLSTRLLSNLSPLLFHFRSGILKDIFGEYIYCYLLGGVCYLFSLISLLFLCRFRHQTDTPDSASLSLLAYKHQACLKMHCSQCLCCCHPKEVEAGWTKRLSSNPNAWEGQNQLKGWPQSFGNQRFSTSLGHHEQGNRWFTEQGLPPARADWTRGYDGPMTGYPRVDLSRQMGDFRGQYEKRPYELDLHETIYANYLRNLEQISEDK